MRGGEELGVVKSRCIGFICSIQKMICDSCGREYSFDEVKEKSEIIYELDKQEISIIFLYVKSRDNNSF